MKALEQTQYFVHRPFMTELETRRLKINWFKTLIVENCFVIFVALR